MHNMNCCSLLKLFYVIDTCINQYHQNYHYMETCRLVVDVIVYIPSIPLLFLRSEIKGEGNSWADKVRGKSTPASPYMEGLSTPTPDSSQIQNSNSPVSPGPVLPSPPPKQNGHIDDVDTDGSTTIEG
jgi:hypothetical protein